MNRVTVGGSANARTLYCETHEVPIAETTPLSHYYYSTVRHGLVNVLRVMHKCLYTLGSMLTRYAKQFVKPL